MHAEIFMIGIGETARDLRRKLGLTQQEMADALEISTVHMSQIENGKSLPSPSLLGRFREVWGLDLYVMTWTEHGDLSRFPPRLRKAAEELKAAWRERVEITVERQRRRLGG